MDLPDSAPSPGNVSAVCAFPLSGQYGFGSRILYYILVAICILFQSKEWIRGPALAAAMLLPAVASVHAIILAALADKDFVDFDIFGALQVISIGVLIAPITVRYSKTYFNTPGRNLVFLWTMFNLAGLIALVVTFFKAEPHVCSEKDGSPMNQTVFDHWFHLSNPNTPNVTLCNWSRNCTFVSAVRHSINDNTQYIQAPNRGMTIDTGTLVSAGCCIPTVISLATMWQKVVVANAVRLGIWPDPEQASDGDREPESVGQTLVDRRVDAFIKLGLGLVERLVFFIFILTIVILGERNFWSVQLKTGAEPMSSIGQWGPIVGTVLTALASAYVYMQEDGAKEGSIQLIPELRLQPSESPPPIDDTAPTGLDPTAPGAGHRGYLANRIDKLSLWIGTPNPERHPDADQRYGLYNGYPTIPGEEERNPQLRRHKQEWQRSRSLLLRNGSVSSLPSTSRPDQGPSRSTKHIEMSEVGPNTRRSPTTAAPAAGTAAEPRSSTATSSTPQLLQVPSYRRR